MLLNISTDGEFTVGGGDKVSRHAKQMKLQAEGQWSRCTCRTLARAVNRIYRGWLHWPDSHGHDLSSDVSHLFPEARSRLGNVGSRWDMKIVVFA